MELPLLEAAIESPPAGAVAFATKLAPHAAGLADPTLTAQQSDGNAKEPGRTEEPRVAKLVGVSSGISSNSKASSVTDLERKLRRAERFGVQVVLSEEEKRNSRAERFGIGSNITGSKILVQAEEEKRKARAERFGLKVDSPVDEAAKKKARLERFTLNPKLDTSEEEKRRFSQDSSKVSGEPNCDLKAKNRAAHLIGFCSRSSMSP